MLIELSTVLVSALTVLHYGSCFYPWFRYFGDTWFITHPAHQPCRCWSS